MAALECFEDATETNSTDYHLDNEMQDRDPIFADFVLKIIGSVKYDGEKSWVCQCRSTNVDNPLETIEKNICLPGIAFTGPQRFTCHIHKQFRSDVVINGALQKSDVTDYLMHLKINYMMMGEPREFKPAGVVGYLMGNTWILSDQQHLRNGHLVQPQEMEYVQVKGYNNITSNQSIIKIFSYYELTNGFGANRDALLMATYFVLGRILRQTLPTMERRNTDESKIGLLFAQEMNVGKTLSQKILNLGQGSHEEDGCLLLSGGDSVTGGTSITMLQKYLEDTTMVVMLNDSRFNRGLLLAWIIHHLKLWGKYEARLCQLLSAIFQRNLKTQQRWVDTLSTIVYTGYLYAATLGETKSLLKEMETFLESELENGDIGVMQKIEKFVRNKIKENDSHDVKNALKSLTENDVAVSTYFSRSEDGCTLHDIQKRDKKNSYRFPMCEFQQNLESWLDFGLNGGDQPLEEEVGPMMTDDEREILLEIDRNIRKDIEELHSQEMRVGSKRQLALGLDTCTTDETAENDAPVVPEDPASSDEPDRFFTPGTIGVFPVKNLEIQMLMMVIFMEKLVKTANHLGKKRTKKEEDRMIVCESTKKKCPGKGYYHLDCLSLTAVPKESPWQLVNVKGDWRGEQRLNVDIFLGGVEWYDLGSFILDGIGHVSLEGSVSFQSRWLIDIWYVF
eukprot:gene16487-18127_t